MAIATRITVSFKCICGCIYVMGASDKTHVKVKKKKKLKKHTSLRYF